MTPGKLTLGGVANHNPGMAKPETVAQYLAALPLRSRRKVRQLRSLVRKAAPRATERLSYGVPTFQLEGPLVHVGGYAHHVSLYGGRSMARSGPLAAFQTGKGTLRFDLDDELPAKAITQLVKARVAENLAKAALKKKR